MALVGVGLMGMGCDTDTAVMPGQEQGVGGGKEDGARAWHDFFYGGRSILTRDWKLAGSGEATESERLRLDVEHSSDPNDETTGLLSIEVPCALFDAAPQYVDQTPGSALLAGFLAVLDGLDSLHCLSEGGRRTQAFGIRVFPYAARRRLLDRYRPLLEGCHGPGNGTGWSVLYFEWIYERNVFDAFDHKTALGCFRVETDSGVPRLWMRVVDDSRPTDHPSDWVVLVDADARPPTSRPDSTPTNGIDDCTDCISGEGGGACAERCRGAQCIECIEHGGGTGCIPPCVSDACTECLSHGGNRGCLDRCDHDALPDACTACVDGSGGTGCIEPCEL